MAKPKKEKSLHEFRIMTLRRASMRWKYKYVCLNNAKVLVDEGVYKNGNPKTGVYFICAHCWEKCQKTNKPLPYYYKRTEVQVDHIQPIVDTEEGFVGWDKYVPALLCELSNLQVLCKPCHKEKTRLENEKRVDTRRQSSYTKSIGKKRTISVKKT